MAYKQVIWDWNGTLVDDTWLCVEIMNEILAQRGLPGVTVAHYRAHFEFPVVNYYRKLGFDVQTDAFEQVSHLFVAEYNRRRYECGLHAQAAETLKLLRQRGHEQVVLSAYLQQTLEEAVGYYGLGSYFEKLIGHPDIFAHSKVDNGRAHMETLAHEPGEVLLVGDTLHDLEVAQAMGVDCVLVQGGHCSAQRLATSGVPVLCGPGALLQWLPG